MFVNWKMTLTAAQIGCCEQLARFFPELAVVRVSVHITAVLQGNSQLQEITLVEFAAGEILIFPSSLPLEFDDRIRIKKEGKAGSQEAIVVALQYHEGSKAVAVKLLQGPSDWITRP
ncbi:MAG: hypothetical protein PVS2B2_16970 [Candidatus Acidiferrum sp.]